MTIDDVERMDCPSTSQFEHLALCPGRHYACTGLPDEHSEDAESGNRIHEWLANQSNAADLTPLERSIANMCRIRTVEIVCEVFGVSPDGLDALTWLHEKRLWSTDSEMRWSGKPDLVVHNHNLTRFLVVDFKTGRVPVPPPGNNTQIFGNVALVFQNMANGGDVMVYGAIVQPMCEAHAPAVFDANQCRHLYAECSALVQRSLCSPRRNPGVACKFCKAYANRERCPESVEFGITTVSTLGGEIQPARMLEIWDKVKAAEKFIEFYKAEVKKQLEANPDAIPGLSLHAGKSTRRVENPRAACKAMKGNIDQEAFESCLTLSLPKLEEAMAKFANLSEKDARTRIEYILGGLILKSTGAPYVVREK